MNVIVIIYCFVDVIVINGFDAIMRTVIFKREGRIFMKFRKIGTEGWSK